MAGICWSSELLTIFSTCEEHAKHSCLKQPKLRAELCSACLCARAYYNQQPSKCTCPSSQHLCHSSQRPFTPWHWLQHPVPKYCWRQHGHQSRCASALLGLTTHCLTSFEYASWDHTRLPNPWKQLPGFSCLLLFKQERFQVTTILCSIAER